MENSTKKVMSILSAIGSIIIGALETIAAISNFATLNELQNNGYDVSGYSLLCLIDLTMGILLIVFGSMTASNKYRYSKKLSVTIIVFLSIFIFFQLYNMATAFTGVLVVGLLLMLFAFITKIIEMSIKSDAPVQQTVATAEQTTDKVQTVDDKCKELKHLKDLGVIDEEQYQKAIAKLIEDYK